MVLTGIALSGSGVTRGSRATVCPRPRQHRTLLPTVKPESFPSPEDPDPAVRSELDPAQRALQQRLLQRVSRTFALTIPRLAPPLADVVGNGYLLCRLIDTIEDELPPAATNATRAAFFARFEAALAGEEDVAGLAAELGRALRPEAPEGERELVARLPEVLAVTARFDATERAALARCTAHDGRGHAPVRRRMRRGVRGSRTSPALERYCYHVAGVVGEMLTELFCHHSPRVAARRDALLALAVPFGNGLQLTNILKDVLDDHHRGVCWLPRDVFGGETTDFRALFEAAEAGSSEAARTLDAGLLRLVALCRGYLDDAVRYVLTIPREEHGMRVFCLWSVSMAVLTLRKVHARRAAALGRGARITRNSVRASLLLSDLCARNDRLLRAVHASGSVGLPPAAPGASFRASVSRYG